jgi:stage V sporulation protein R
MNSSLKIFVESRNIFIGSIIQMANFRIENRDFKEIKRLLMRRHLNGGLPEIKLTEPNYRGDGSMMLQHYHDGRPLHEPYIFDVLVAIRAIWQRDVYLASKSDDG